MARYLLTTLVLVSTLMAGCAGMPSMEQTPTPEASPAVTNTATPSETPVREPDTTPTAGAMTMRLWVPPQFDPASGTSEGSRLQNRLDAFAKRRPGVSVEVRVKSLDGPGSMQETLASANAAAPLALPDLVAIPRSLLEELVPEGLLYPYDGLVEPLGIEDWYPYALELAVVQESVYGLPFAGNAQVLAYRPDSVAEPPQRWSEIIENGVTLLFPAADPQALYTLTMYRASGGLASDDNGSPHLDSDILGDVLAHYAEAEQAGAMPYWITQYQSDEQVWQAFLEDRTTQAATWATNYLAAPPEDVAMATLPTPDGEAYTLATGWVWALTTRPAENQQLSVELAEFLTEGNFLGQWSGSLGYLPVRPSALAAGPDRTLNQVIEEVVQSAVLFPPSDVIVSLGIPLQGATVDVLKQQADPVSAAQAAAAGLNEP